MKNNLIILEGLDGVGKDYILNNLNLENFKIIKQNNNPPDYELKKEDFSKWLTIFLSNQINEILESNSNVIIARMFSSEFVFSKFFKRKKIKMIDLYFKLKEKFNIYQIIIFYKEVDDYKKRCELKNENIRYSKENCLLIQNLYKQSPFNKIFKTYFIEMSLTNNLDIEKIIKEQIIKEQINGTN